MFLINMVKLIVTINIRAVDWMPQYTIAIVHSWISQTSDWFSKQSAWNTNIETYFQNFLFLLTFMANHKIYISQYSKIYALVVSILHNLPNKVFFILLILSLQTMTVEICWM